jgi:hypothetical protein
VNAGRVRPAARGDDTGTFRRLSACWILLVVSALLLITRYPELPHVIPAYRTLSGAPTHLLPKSPFSVFRIVAMGIGQLGATSVMASGAAREGQASWATFWVSASLAASAKTLIESVQYALLGAARGAWFEAAFLLAALVPVVAFLGVATRLWRANRLESRQALAGPQMLLVATFIVLWLVCAVTPRWMN